MYYDFHNVRGYSPLDLMRLGIGSEAMVGTSITQIVEAFYRTIGFPRLESEAVIRRAIAKGVQDGLFGYIGRTGLVEVDRLREGSGYLIDPSLVQIGVPLAEGEIDMSSALIILPKVIAPHRPAEAGEMQAVEEQESQPYRTPVEPVVYTSPVTPQAIRTHVRLSMRLSRQQLYASWNAFTNLAEAAGNIRLTVEAQNANGFDPGWLRNAVLEPLDEADVKVEQGD